MNTLMKNPRTCVSFCRRNAGSRQAGMEAAQVAAALAMQDKSGKRYLDFHQKLLTGRGQADKARALAVAKNPAPTWPGWEGYGQRRGQDGAGRELQARRSLQHPGHPVLA